MKEIVFKEEDPFQKKLRGLEAALESHMNGHSRLEANDKARLDREITELKERINVARGIEEGV